MIESSNFKGDDLKLIFKIENFKTSISSDSNHFLFLNFINFILTGHYCSNTLTQPISLQYRLRQRHFVYFIGAIIYSGASLVPIPKGKQRIIGDA